MWGGVFEDGHGTRVGARDWLEIELDKGEGISTENGVMLIGHGTED